MTSPFYVTSNTREVFVNTSTIATGSSYIVFLSSLSSRNIITIRDSAGEASTNKQVIVSTTNGIFFNTGNSISSYSLTSPYSYLTVRPISASQWTTVQSFGLLPSQSAANIASVIVPTTLTANSLSLNSTVISTLQGNFLQISSLSTQALEIGGSLFNLSSFLCASTFTCSSLSTVASAYFGENGSTLSNVDVGSNFFINGDIVLQDSLYVSSAAFVSSLFTSSFFQVNQSTVLNSVSSSSLTTLSSNTFQNYIQANDIFQCGFNFNVSQEISTLENTFVGRLTQVSTLSTLQDATFSTLTVHDVLLLPFLSSISSVTLRPTNRNITVRESTITTNVAANFGRVLSSLTSLLTNHLFPDTTYKVEHLRVNAKSYFLNGSTLPISTTSRRLETQFMQMDSLSTIRLQINQGVQSTILFTSTVNTNLFFQVSTMQILHDLSVDGTITKVSGSFDIQHPLTQTKRLVHSFLEAPRCDLLYRGSVLLSNGKATVDLEKEATSNGSTMTPGTFSVLTQNPQIFLRVNERKELLRGSLSSNLLTITSQTPTSSSRVDWMVVAERADPFIQTWDKTDKKGMLIPETFIPKA